MMIENLRQISLANRLIDLERLASDTSIQGDFEGSVTAYWVRLGSSGEGIVKYNSKEYKTKPIGFVSAKAGKEVELTFANGVYYTKF